MFSCRRFTSLQQTRLVSLDADRSRRSRYAPVYGTYYTIRAAPGPKPALASETLFHGAFDLALGGLFGDLAPLVVLLFTAGNGDLEFYVAVLFVESQGNERLAVLLGLAGETRYLPFVQEELPVPGRELLAVGGVLVRRDVSAKEKYLPVCHPSVAIL